MATGEVVKVGGAEGLGEAAVEGPAVVEVVEAAGGEGEIIPGIVAGLVNGGTVGTVAIPFGSGVGVAGTELVFEGVGELVGVRGEEAEGVVSGIVGDGSVGGAGYAVADAEGVDFVVIVVGSPNEDTWAEIGFFLEIESVGVEVDVFDVVASAAAGAVFGVVGGLPGEGGGESGFRCLRI